jgi:hypothetical protein
MESLFDTGRLADSFQIAVEWVLLNVANVWTLLQVGVLCALFGLALLLSRRLRPLLVAWLDRAAVPARFAAQLKALPSVLTPLIYLLMLWLALAVMLQSTWPSRSGTLPITATNSCQMRLGMALKCGQVASICIPASPNKTNTNLS